MEVFGNSFTMQTVNTGVSSRIFLSVWILVMEIFGNRFAMQTVNKGDSSRIFMSI